MQNEKPIIELSNICKAYPTGDPAVLEGLNLAVAPGRSIAITGPSGCGKSTLLNIIGALDRADSGQVMLDGRDLSSCNDDALAAIRNRCVGFVFQSHHLLPQCTVLENVLLPTLAQSARPDAAAIERAKCLLEYMGLAKLMNRRPGQLSGGQQQRTAVARAMIMQPKVLLADEPTGSLDHKSGEELADLLAALSAQEGLTVVAVTHWEGLARRMSHVYQLRDGKLHSGGSQP